MRQLYGYDIAVRWANRWRVTHHGERRSSRSPEATARGLLEQWIVSNEGHLPGGRITVPRSRERWALLERQASVRVRVFRIRPRAQGRSTADLRAVAYLAEVDG